ncbi:putative N-acetyltransferase YhbS [Kribbella voronezhensis]|uniref:Putative N-acetyltransferase YhbS n=1 Tax=Kribbella voronezhensis TaxID=2512212 RepID=A0A4R7TDJ7_9ACTN|nr:GNAT family N-acetyltransferase [Kribbella voronezhensis]TDU90210.1 putative N-acetyltransferase YhbS [Kribbella voronezhensis]
MGFEIRAAVPGDAVGIAGVWAAAMPHLVKTARGIEAELRTNTSRVVLIAVEDDEVVGYGNVYLPEQGAESPRLRITVQVPPTERRRGIGSALAEAITEAAAKAGAGGLLVVVSDDDDSKRFAIARGFTLARRMSHAKAELSQAPAPAAVPEGLRLVTFDEVDPQRLWDAWAAVADGDPSGLSHTPAYDEWLAADWNHPDLRRDLSIAVLSDDQQVVSFVSTTADPERRVIWSNLTGTIPSYRGRGLAKVVKSAALARSRDAGFVTAFTGNDSNNLPMLAVNRRLGYETTASAWTAEKNL